MSGLIGRILCNVCHRLPLKSGLSALTMSPAVTAHLENGGCERIAVLRNGLTIPVDPRDYNGRMLLLFGTVDPKIVETCRKLLQRGDCFLDVGANHGAVGLLCHDVVGPTGSVHLFEPQPDLCRRIRACLNKGQAPRAHVHEVALLDREGSLELTVDPEHTGTASLIRNSVTGDRILVPVKDVATFLPSLIGERSFGVKLDVEGAELVLLRVLLRLPRLRFILFECNSAEEREAIWQIVSTAGLALYGIPKTLLSVRMKRLHSTQDMGHYHDLVALRQETRSS